MTEATDRWAAELAAWAIPDHILEAAPTEPFGFPADMFTAPPPGTYPPSRAALLAAEAVGDGGSLLDVGCGGGAAAFAAAPPATELIGVDRQRDMLERFEDTARERGIPATTILGDWPDVAEKAPVADVVVSHNVLYNVPDLAPFVEALHTHARRRVVIEITETHPQTSRAPLWKHFWDLDRPTGPSAWLAAEILAQLGHDIRAERTPPTRRDEQRAAQVAPAFWCRQLCLPADRADEVAALVEQLPFPQGRVTIWWDV